MHSGNIHRKSYTFDTDILAWKPNLGKPTFSVSFYFNLKESSEIYNLIICLVDKLTVQICCPSSIPDCLPISESPIMKWYSLARDPLNPKSPWVCFSHTPHLECASYTFPLMHSCTQATCSCSKLLLRSSFIILFNDKTLNLNLQRDRWSRLDLALIRSTVTT